MLGTLVVCLPSQFVSGEFVVKHRGLFQTYAWGEAIKEQTEPTRIHWAAFYGDVDHQIEQVWAGIRVTLTYLIRHSGDAGSGSEPEPAREARNSLVRDELRALLNDRRFLAKGGTLAFPCSHLYHQDARFQRKPRPLSRRTVAALKGRDHDVAAAALAEGLEVTLHPYMIENCADETWRLEHFPTSREQDELSYRMGPEDLESALPIQSSMDAAGDFDVIWVDPPPHFNSQPTMYTTTADGRAQATDSDLPALMHLHACEYSATGYFGNEGSEVDFYVYGVLHVAIPQYGEAARAVAGPSLEPSPVSRRARKDG